MARREQPGDDGGSALPDPAAMRFEEATAELEAIIERIERGEIGLEESLAQRRRGEALVRRCREILDAAEQELETVAGEAPPGEPGSGKRPSSGRTGPLP